MQDGDMSKQVADEFEHLLNESMRKIRHCVGQLNDEQLWNKPGDGLNSVANLLLHMAGSSQRRMDRPVTNSCDDLKRSLRMPSR
jgi:hypothetical protein